MVSFGLVMAQRLSGAGGVIQYSNTLFKLSGTAIKSGTACIIVGAFQVAASGVSFLLIDKVGRRTLLLISSGFVTACLILLIVYFGLLERGTYRTLREPSSRKIPKRFFFFFFSAIPLPSLIAPLPNPIRTTAVFFLLLSQA